MCKTPVPGLRAGGGLDKGNSGAPNKEGREGTLAPQQRQAHRNHPTASRPIFLHSFLPPQLPKALIAPQPSNKPFISNSGPLALDSHKRTRAPLYGAGREATAQISRGASPQEPEKLPKNLASRSSLRSARGAPESPREALRARVTDPTPPEISQGAPLGDTTSAQDPELTHGLFKRPPLPLQGPVTGLGGHRQISSQHTHHHEHVADDGR